MKYDFDTAVSRRNTNSLKYDFAAERGRPETVTPMWVADMDFRAPAEVLRALEEKTAHGIFGYSEPKADYYHALTQWFSERHGWRAEPENFILTCGVVFSICAAIRALTQEGDSVLICQPVYYPFEESILVNNRKAVVSELKNTDGFYTVDFEDFEKKIAENDVKVFLLCNPHNPVGRVWTAEELRRMGEICLKHHVFVISDEIHADFVFRGNRHTVFSTVNPKFEQNCIICTAPTKTFNLAGLHIANTYIANGRVRSAFKRELDRIGYSQPNVMGMVACEAAYRFGAPWLDALKEYLTENLSFVRECFRSSPVKLTEPQGTYLVWLDCRGLKLSDQALKTLVTEKAGLWLDDGYIFGKGGSGFERVNIACPRSVLQPAMERLKRAAEEI